MLTQTIINREVRAVVQQHDLNRPTDLLTQTIINREVRAVVQQDDLNRPTDQKTC